MAIGIIYVGRLLDKIAVKYILIPSFVLFGISTACIALTPPIAPLFLLPYFFGGLFGSGTAIPFTKVVVGWFDNKRAIALGIMAGLTALGSSATPLIANSLINNVGWRAAYALLGLLCVTVSVTLILTFVRARAERHVRGKLVTETVEHGRAISLDLPGKTLREALHSRSFWIIAIGLGLVGGVVVGLQVNLVPMMVQRGLTVSQSAILLSVFGIAGMVGMVGRIVGGFIIDKVHATIIGPIVIILPVLGILLLHPPFASALLAASLMGFAFGVEFDLMALLVSRYLGLKAFGKIIGLMGAIFLIGTGSGPVLVSVGAKLTGNYDAVMPVLMGILIVAAVSIMFLGK